MARVVYEGTRMGRRGISKVIIRQRPHKVDSKDSQSISNETLVGVWTSVVYDHAVVWRPRLESISIAVYVLLGTWTGIYDICPGYANSPGPDLEAPNCESHVVYQADALHMQHIHEHRHCIHVRLSCVTVLVLHQNPMASE